MSLSQDRRGLVAIGVLAGIDMNKLPKNFRDAMSREDRQEWASAAYDLEYQGLPSARDSQDGAARTGRKGDLHYHLHKIYGRQRGLQEAQGQAMCHG